MAAIENLTELETKVEELIQAFQSLRNDYDTLRKDLENKDLRIAELEQEKEGLGGERDSLRDDLRQSREKLDTAAGKVQGILKRLESIA